MTNGNAARKVFVSYKYKDWNVSSAPVSEYTPGEDTGYLHTPRHYVDKIIQLIGEDHIYKGELSGEDASHLTDDTIDSRLKEKIFDSSVTIVLLSPNMWDKARHERDQWIPNEIAYALRYKRRGDVIRRPTGMLAVALPDMNGSYSHAVVHRECGVRSWQTASFFRLLRENMFNRKDKNQTLCQSCRGYHHHGDDHSYIHPVKWEDFIVNHSAYINHAAALREREEEFELIKRHEI